MAIWKQDDPHFNIGTPRLSFLDRRVHRLRKLEEKRPGKFSEQLKNAKEDFRKEFDMVINTDLLL